MSSPIAALPMYDWPEARAEVDAQWSRIRGALWEQGVEAPAHLVRRNADMPAVPGGIRDRAGRLVAPDPATLPSEELDYATLWRHPRLLFGQTCWGPLETTGLADHVRVISQPDYSDCEGGSGELYSSAILMRGNETSMPSPDDGASRLPLELLRGKRFAYNEPHSMSGVMALERDLADAGEGLSIFSSHLQTGGHRASITAVAEGRAEVCAIDCRSWSLFRRFEQDAAKPIRVVGWTARRKGLPYISACEFAPLHDAIRRAVAASS